MQKKCAKKLKIINQLPFGNKRRDKLFNKLFGDIETNNIIKEGFHCNYGFNIHIGSNNYINFDVTILDSYELYIGNNVSIAPKVLISPVIHPLLAKDRRNLIINAIHIEDDA